MFGLVEMVQNEDVTELLCASALGSLDPEEEKRVAQHLATCAACQAELAGFRAVTDRLALSVAEAEPPARLKQQLMERAQAPGGAQAPAARLSRWQRLSQSVRRSAPAWGLASLALALILLAANLLLWQRLRSQERPALPALPAVALAGTEAAPEAVGTLVISADGEYGALVVDGMPVLDEERQYQLWLIRGEQRTSGGVFSVNEEGYGVLWIESHEPLSSYSAFGITVEPAGGSPGPTGDRVLGSSS